MSTLLELLSQLPDEMKMRNHSTGQIKTVREWRESPGVQRESKNGSTGYLMHDSKFNYGRETHKVIYYPGAGQIFSQTEKVED